MVLLRLEITLVLVSIWYSSGDAAAFHSGNSAESTSLLRRSMERRQRMNTLVGNRAFAYLRCSRNTVGRQSNSFTATRRVPTYLSSAVCSPCHASSLEWMSTRPRADRVSCACLRSGLNFHRRSYDRLGPPLRLQVQSLSTDTHEKKEEIYHELESLSAELRRLDELYYAPGKVSTLSDAEYDVLASREKELCVAHPDLLERLERDTGLGHVATRFGGRVGPISVTTTPQDPRRAIKTIDDDDDDDDDSSPPPKRSHLEKMMSLDNVMTEEDTVKWVERVRKLLNKHMKSETAKEGDDDDVKDIVLIAEPKLDGLSLSIRYALESRYPPTTDDASDDVSVYQLQWAATRGDGTMGEDVTDAAVQVSSTYIPDTLTIRNRTDYFAQEEEPAFLEIRGEVLLPVAAFEKYRKSNDSDATTADVGNVTTSQQDGVSGDSPSSTIPPLVFANARNAASGILQRTKNLSSEESKELCSQLAFYAYDVVAGDQQTETPHYFSSSTKMRQFLNEVGFQPPAPVAKCVVKTSGLGNETQALDRVELQALFDYYDGVADTRSGLDHEVDGVVYKLDDIQQRLLCGSSSRAPRWAVAHKFPSQMAVTRIMGLEVQVGRTGALTPVAILEPVSIGGTNVSRASLHNFFYAAKVLDGKDPGQKGHVPQVESGTQVVVARAGDVIPQVVRRVLEGGEGGVGSPGTGGNDYISLLPPAACPACGSAAVTDNCKEETPESHGVDNEEDDMASHPKSQMPSSEGGQVLRCGGPQLECEPRAVGSLAHAYSRQALNIMGLSVARLTQLRNAGIIRQPSDVFLLVDEDEGDDKARAQALLNQTASLDGWGQKSAENLAVSARAVARTGVSLDRFIYSLGIRHVGEVTSKLIASTYGTVDTFLGAIESAQNGTSNPFHLLSGDGDTQEGVLGAGPVLNESVIAFAQEQDLVDAAKELASRIRVLDDQSEESDVAPASIDGGPFQGLSVVFTGAIPGMSRALAKDAARRMGARSAPASVSKSTDLVVEGEKGGKSAQKARDLGIGVMTGAEFLSAYEEYRQ